MNIVVIFCQLLLINFTNNISPDSTFKTPIQFSKKSNLDFLQIGIDNPNVMM